MNIQTSVVIRTSFEAIHCWPDCPIPEVSFLKNKHRHIFHIEMKFTVDHNDRDIEFIYMKRQINEYLKEKYDGQNLGATSCEMIAEDLLNQFIGCSYVSCFEDNENGAEVYNA